MNGSTTDASVFSAQAQAAIDKQRRILAESVLKIRLAGASLWLLLALTFGLLSETSSYRAQIPYVFTYVIIAAVVAYAYKHLPTIPLHSTLLLAVIDVPFVFLMQTDLAFRTHEYIRPFGVSLAITLIIIFIAILTLRRMTIFAVTGVGAFLLAYCENALDFPLQFILTDATLLLFSGTIGIFVVNFQYKLIHKTHFEEQARTRLARYFSPAVAAQIATEGTESRRCHITVLMADIRGFTELAETMDPDKLVALLNEYFQAMVGIIFEHGGTLDKFMGDGLLAYFGGHNEDKNSAEAAVECSIAMLNRLAELNTLRSSRNEPEFAVGIGIHSGPAVLGDVGSPERRDYTVIGDTVNVTARIEELTKEQKLPILVSNETKLHSGNIFAWEPVAEVPIRGRQQPVVLFSPVSKSEKSP